MIHASAKPGDVWSIDLTQRRATALHDCGKFLGSLDSE
jgi:hypothetical protein